MALRVVFADDNYLVREGVSALLAVADDVDLVDVVANPELLLRSVAVNSPDAVLTDIRMPPTHTD
ncbi:MAG TPA: DNA-binding response regulator, partial [Pedococcus sp.]|nr:DNA-binding response regulator [Pedococcus sp.]